jgi:hypothetical protein
MCAGVLFLDGLRMVLHKWSCCRKSQKLLQRPEIDEHV